MPVRPARSREILIVAKGYPPDVGGVQTYSEFVARAYLKAGFEPRVVSMFDGPRGWGARDYPEGRVPLWNAGPGSQPVVFSRMLAACRRELATRSFAFVHPTTWRPAAAVAPWRGRTPMVLTVHGQEVLNTPRLLQPIMYAMLTRADQVVAVSNPTLEAARGVMGTRHPRGHWFAAFNGLSYEEEARAFARPPRGDALVIIYSFCRLAERKNIAGAVEAIRRVRDRGIGGFRYVIAGGGPLKDAIAARIAETGLGDRVEMLGYLPEADIPGWYRRADIFLHPQTAPKGGRDLEGFGLAIADSMSFGALALVGEAGGPADFVRDGCNGLVVDGENIDAIADKLADVLTDRARLDALAATGRQWALDTLSWDHHVAAILNALRGSGQLAD